eukprot:10405291-Heterocapsa_arctica.AAC.1
MSLILGEVGMCPSADCARVSLRHPQAIIVAVEGLRPCNILIHTHSKERGWRFARRLFERLPPRRQ